MDNRHFEQSEKSDLPQLPKGWVWATIAQLVDKDGVFVDGDWVESKDQDPQGDVRLIQLADIGDGFYRNRSNRFLTSKKAHELGCTFLENNDLLIARMPDPLGRACIFPLDEKLCVTVVDVCIVRTGTHGPNHRWLMYFVNAPLTRAEISKLQSGSTRKRISRGNLATIQIPVPPLAEQHRIVRKIEELFSDLDAAVAELEKAKAQLKRYRQAVLKAAVEGKLTAEWRAANKDKIEPASVLLERIREERAKNANGKEKALLSVNESELGELPKGWKSPPLGDVLEIKPGGTPSRQKPEYWDGDIPWVSSGEVSFNRIRATREYITQDAVRHSNAKLHPPGTVLLAMIGEGKTRGHAAILDVFAARAHS